MRQCVAVLAVAFLAACASTTPSTSKSKIDMKEPRRVLGNDAGVRIDAMVYEDELSETTAIPITYEVTNHRKAPILIADLIPASSYDGDTQTVTIDLGSEVPGENFLPRLILIAPEESKTFSTVAHSRITTLPGASPWIPRPSLVRLRLNFLTDAKPFQELIGITQKGVYDPKLAADLFPKWVDGNETVLTNPLPMHWRGTSRQPSSLGPIAEPPHRPGRP